MKPRLSRYWLNPKETDPAVFQQLVETICQTYAATQDRYPFGIHTISTDEMTGIQALERLFATKPTCPGQVEKREFEYVRHGTQTLIANFEVATGAILAPTIGKRRTEMDFAQHIACTIAIDPQAEWVFIVDQLSTHQSETLVQVVAAECASEDSLGIKGKTGILESMASRMRFLSDPSHRNQ